ncbi:MAG TPA: SIS domain-containing protein [Chloroflexota bacterium]|nr:SIS domain-containing protein [Chloroflexota bacterium]
MDSSMTNPETFARGYIDVLTAALGRLDLAAVARVVETLWTAYENDQQIFVLGNGGSAATASHIVTDLTKGALGHRGDAPARPVRAFSLTDNLPLLSAWANDVGYDSVFLGQLRPYVRAGDVVLGISASGNSENVLRAIRYAREVGATTIGLTGFGGGKLATLVDLGIVVDSNHYGIVEDVHMQIGHVICYFFRQRILERLEARTG